MSARFVALVVSCGLAGACEDDGVALTWGKPVATTYGVFAGRTPCPVDDCEKMKIGLHLHEDTATREPTQYEMRRIYVDGSDAVHDTTGTWRLTTGTPLDPEAEVIALDPGSPDGFANFQRVGDDILLMLDADLNLLVGNAAWSYTLNRIE